MLYVSLFLLYKLYVSLFFGGGGHVEGECIQDLFWNEKKGVFGWKSHVAFSEDASLTCLKPWFSGAFSCWKSTPWEVQFYHFTSETTPGLVYQCLGAPDGRFWMFGGCMACLPFFGKEGLCSFHQQVSSFKSRSKV